MYMIYMLGKAHNMCSMLSVRSFPKFAFVTVPVFTWLLWPSLILSRKIVWHFLLPLMGVKHWVTYSSLHVSLLQAVSGWNRMWLRALAQNQETKRVYTCTFYLLPFKKKSIKNNNHWSEGKWLSKQTGRQSNPHKWLASWKIRSVE